MLWPCMLEMLSIVPINKEKNKLTLPGSFLSICDKWRLGSVLCKCCPDCVFWGLFALGQDVVTLLSVFLTTGTCFYTQAKKALFFVCGKDSNYPIDLSSTSFVI